MSLKIQIAQARKYAKQDVKFYTDLANSAVRECRFWFTYRLEDGVKRTRPWGGRTTETGYEFCRTKFYNCKAAVKYFRRRLQEATTKYLATFA